MTDVFVTRTGAKYHADFDCPGFADAEAEHGHPIERWPVSLHGLDQTPCAVCWPATGRWDAWAQFAHEVERCGESQYEVLFVKQVLRHVRDLKPSDVLIQQTARGKTGQTYRIDFVLQGSNGRKVAIEIDGRDKAPGQRTTEEVQRRVDRRRADLRAAGWRILNLSNERVANRSPECVVEIESELRDLATPGWTEPQPQPTITRPVHFAPPSLPPNQKQEGNARKWILGVSLVGVLAAVTWFALPVGQGAASAEPNGPSCPSSHPIKGNVSRSGDRIFHRPGWQYYKATWPEDCFESESAAEDAGYRASEVR